MRNELLKGLSQEQLEKVNRCKNGSDLLQLAKDEGFELNDEQLAAVSGGGCLDDSVNCVSNCPKCGTVTEGDYYLKPKVGKFGTFTCPNCGHQWEEKL